MFYFNYKSLQPFVFIYAYNILHDELKLHFCASQSVWFQSCYSSTSKSVNNHCYHNFSTTSCVPFKFVFMFCANNGIFDIHNIYC